MAKNFLATTDYNDHSDEETLRELGTAVLSNNGSTAICLLHKDGGMIVGLVTPFFFGKKRMASELGWWVDPDKRNTGIGKELLEGFEFWAKITKCDLISMVSLDDELGSFYEKNGYKLHERSYLKVL